MWALNILLFLFLCFISWESVSSHQIYLKRITIYKTHEDDIFDRHPEVNIGCQADGVRFTRLDRVRDVDVKYTYGKEVQAVTHVDEGGCRNCTLTDKDILTGDETFGTIELCQEDFRRTGQTHKSVEGEFDADFECYDCVPPPPPSPPPPPTIVYVTNRTSTSSSFSSVFGKASSHVWQSPWFIGLLVGLTLLGLIFGGVSYHYYQSLREKAEQERMREFESILGDPDVDFEAMVEQDDKAFNSNFWRKFQWKPRTWLSVKTHDTDD